MKLREKAVLWGYDDMENDIVFAMQLKAQQNKIDFWIYKRKDLNKHELDQLNESWVNNQETELPQGFTYIEHEMSASSFLPDNVLAKDMDSVQRLKQEWLIAILSQRLFQMYKIEIDNLNEKVKDAKKYEKSLNDSAKDIWEKIKLHREEQNLTRENVEELKEDCNKLFEKIKILREQSNNEYENESNANIELVESRMKEFDKELNNQFVSFKKVFEELKAFQQLTRDMNFTKQHREEIRLKINQRFDALNVKREAYNEQRGSFVEHRLKGLEEAIQKMQDSINYDKRQREIQEKGMGRADSKLEIQLREMKLKVFDDKIKSKQEKLDDMLKTKAQLSK
jgi:hypothetical protein